MSQEVLAAIIGAIISGFITWLITWSITKSDLGQKNSLLEARLRDNNAELTKLNSALASAKQKAERFQGFESKYLQVKERLQSSSVVMEYFQPVLLVGPRFVGKTSLLQQWHAPWNHSMLDPTKTHNTSIVPIYDFKRSNVEPHFADPEILTDVNVHLKLKVHDFPGELSAQKSIVEEAVAETRLLRESTGKSLGVVLICLFNAENAVKGLSESTNDYYNGELFASLQSLVAHHQVGIERLILVFNKFDLLKEKCPSKPDLLLLHHCIDIHKPLVRLLRGACNPERVCEVVTILGREEMVLNNRGAPIVMGEAARNFVEAMAGIAAAHTIIKESASTLTAPVFA